MMMCVGEKWEEREVMEGEAEDMGDKGDVKEERAAMEGEGEKEVLGA